MRLSAARLLGRSTSTPARDDGGPRLVLRFAVAVGVCLTLAAIAIILVIRYLNIVEAERNAARHARYVAHALLQDELTAADFGAPLPADRRAALDRMFRAQVLVDGTLLVALTRPDGSIAYATDPAVARTIRIDRGRVAEALAGTVTSTDGTLRRSVRGKGTTATAVLVSYVGATRAGVAVFYQDYRPIADAANAAFLPIAGTLELVVVILFLLLVPILSRVTKRLRLQLDQIRHQAQHDDLTGLPNRARFREALAAELPAGSAVVMLLDLDGFKEVNDALGHDVGDALLREIPDRLEPAVPAGAMLARLGGDEFALLVPGPLGREATALAVALRARLEAPFTVRGLSLAVNASVGIAISPEHGNDGETVMKNADVAMYEAKRGKTGWSVYDASRDPNDPAKVALVAELHGAFEAQEITVLYQPKLDLRTGALSSVEALARWQHPTKGLLAPEVWLTLAERAGLHGELVRAIVGAVARQIRRWDETGVTLRASINLTMLDLLDLRLPETVGEILRAQGVSPARIDFEITEGVFMANPDRVRRVLTSLSEMGAGISIDDFGTGYSSLTYLSSLPADELKIDRSFVTGITTNPRNAEIVRSTIQLGHSLGLRVVAEGVETEGELDLLLELGCDVAQGYYVGRPSSADVVTTRVLGGLAPGPATLSQAPRDTLPGPTGGTASLERPAVERPPETGEPAGAPAAIDPRTTGLSRKGGVLDRLSRGSLELPGLAEDADDPGPTTREALRTPTHGPGSDLEELDALIERLRRARSGAPPGRPLVPSAQTGGSRVD